MIPGSLIQSLNLPNGAYITNIYDGNARLTETALQNSRAANIDVESYTYNKGNQRTEQTFTAGNYMNYTYDSIGELQTALGKEPGGVTNRLHEQFGYTYDSAGNLYFRTNNALLQNYTVNNLNEMTTVSSSGTLTVGGTTTSPANNVTVNTSNAVVYVDNTFASINQPWNANTNVFTAVAHDTYGRMDTNVSTVRLAGGDSMTYDLNGNLLMEKLVHNGGTNRVFAYDDENQLVAVWVTNVWMSQFTYDGKMRRRIRREFTWGDSAWSETNEVHYIYDGNVVIQERDADNVPQVTYTRGTDLSGSLQGAGGIGGLLARTANPLTLSAPLLTFATAFYHADGNGNVTCLIYTNQTIAAKYEYDPYGNILSQIGYLADANLYRFSSKEYHQASGLFYYLYRYYDADLQRWSNRDPLGEQGFESRRNEIRADVRYLLPSAETLEWPDLVRFVANNPNSRFDSLGLTLQDCLNAADKAHNDQINSCRHARNLGASFCIAAGILGIGTGLELPFLGFAGYVSVNKAEGKCEDRANARWRDEISECYNKYGNQKNANH